jgi:uncharacterized alkaline shock family protein YloU
VEQEEGTGVAARQPEDSGIKIADEVVAVIAGLAATEVKGVAGMAGGIVGGITERLGLKNLQRGVKVEVGTKETVLDLYIIVEYGARIPEVAQSVQEEVRRAVETMTGLKVVQVNVHVQGVAFEREGTDQESHRGR